jgi:hypothetical protein
MVQFTISPSQKRKTVLTKEVATGITIDTFPIAFNGKPIQSRASSVEIPDLVGTASSKNLASKLDPRLTKVVQQELSNPRF